jgi:hypothetical protein
VPSSKDFFEAGIELFDFAWDTAAVLWTNLSEAKEWGIDPDEVSEEYWAAAKRRLTTALVMTQQGVEFILKGKIAEISPYLLLAESPAKWPSPYDGDELDFAQFKTVDAQDLVRLHDTVQDTQLSAAFVDKFNTLRAKRNTISHSIDKKLQVHTSEVIETILSLHKALFPKENWAKVRATFINNSPNAMLNGGDYSKNIACHELEVVIEILTPAAVREFFLIDKKQRRYLCPKCLDDANKDVDFDYKLAVIRPKGASSTKLYCPICDAEHQVVREDCKDSDCPGNVLSSDWGICLTCGR